MRISKADLDAYRQALHDIATQAVRYVGDAIGDVPTSRNEARAKAIEAVTDTIGVHGDAAQALAAQLFDEVCEMEGIDAEFELFDDLIDEVELAKRVYYFSRALVEGNGGAFVDDCSMLAGYYVNRCNYESMIRNCAGNGLRYARVPTGADTCDFCLMLASRGFVYHSDASAAAGMHRYCVVGDTQVFGPEVLGATRREYQGLIVHLTTASGDHLSVTPNHPILTTRGWIPANEVNNGDYLFRASIGHGKSSSIPDEYDAPPRIEDVFSSLAFLDSAEVSTVPTSAEDFHGDGIANGEVDIVRAYRLLSRMRNIADSEQFVHSSLAPAHLALTIGSGKFPRDGATDLFVKTHDTPFGSIMGGAGLRESLFGSHLGCSDLASSAVVSAFDPSLIEPTIESGSGDAVRLGECIQTLACLIAWEEVIGHGHLVGGNASKLCDMDSDTLEMIAKNVGVASIQTANLAEGVPANVEMCRLVDKRISIDTCHVYNLTTSSSWYFANNIITHNCDCIVVPGKGGDEARSSTQVEGYDPDALYDLWQGRMDATASERAKRNGTSAKVERIKMLDQLEAAARDAHIRFKWKW